MPTVLRSLPVSILPDVSMSVLDKRLGCYPPVRCRWITFSEFLVCQSLAYFQQVHLNERFFNLLLQVERAFT